MAVHLPFHKGTRHRTALARFWKYSGRWDTPGVGRRRYPEFSVAAPGSPFAWSCGIILASIVPPEGFEAAQFRYLLTEDASTIPAGLEKDYGVIPVPAESTVTIADCEALEAPDYKSMIRSKVTVVILDAALLTEENRSAYETLRDRLNTLGIPLLLDRSAQEADSSTWDVLWNIINP